MTIEEVFDERISKLCKKQDFYSGALVREVKRAMKKAFDDQHYSQKQLGERGVAKVKSFVNLLTRG